MKKRRIFGSIDTFLLDPENYGNIYFGCLDEVPKNVSMLLTKRFISVFSMREGYSLHYTTLDNGQYEIFAYPKCFGRLTLIDQNNVGINALSGWKSKEISVYDSEADEAEEYYMYYSEYKQFDDDSTFVFKI